MQARRGVLVYYEAPARRRRDPTGGLGGPIGGALGAIRT